MPTLTLTLPRPHPGQRAILAGARRFNVVACGRRFGKTTLGINRLVPPALDGYPVAWFAPTYKYMIEVWREFLRILKPVTRHVSKQDKRIELLTGGVVEFWTLQDPDAGRSRKYKRVVIDEAAKCRHLEQAWQESIRPTLTDWKGDADFYSTPKGRNFFWQCYVRGQDPLQPDWAKFSLPTAANPHIDPAEIEAARTGFPERVFQQEYLATFLDEAGGVFRGVLQAIDKGRHAADLPTKGVHYVTGADLARKEDFTVLSTLRPDGRQCYFDRFNQISWERQIGAIRDVGLRYKGAVHLDSTGIGDPIFERVRALGLNAQAFQFTNASKNALIDNLAMGIEQGKLRLMDVPEQTDELLSFEYTLTKARNVQLGAPEGMHDDTVIALALAYWGQSKAGRLRFL